MNLREQQGNNNLKESNFKEKNFNENLLNENTEYNSQKEKSLNKI